MLGAIIWALKNCKAASTDFQSDKNIVDLGLFTRRKSYYYKAVWTLLDKLKGLNSQLSQTEGAWENQLPAKYILWRLWLCASKGLSEESMFACVEEYSGMQVIHHLARDMMNLNENG